VLLLVAAAVSIAAVFAVQRIESGGGPFAEPWATPFISPDGDGVQDTAEVRFTTERAERVTVAVTDDEGVVLRTLARDEPVDGRHVLEWDGTDDDGRRVPEGTYRIQLTRAGDSRRYTPPRPIEVDVTPPLGRLDSATWYRGKLGGLALLEPGALIEARGPDGAPLEDLRSIVPRASARSAQPLGPRIAGTRAVRFFVPLDRGVVPLDALRLDAVDRAGNRLDLLAGPEAPKIAVEEG
jgi:hypothetical protein